MQSMSTPRRRQLALAGAALVLSLLWGAHARGAEAPATQAEPADGLVHCLLPGQVRRLGLSTTVMPRRATRLSPAQCQAAGGEYVEPQAGSGNATSPGLATATTAPQATPNIAPVATQDRPATVAALMPLATQGAPLAQTSLAELLDQRGDRAEAQSWYEKAAAQGSARALIGLAGFLEKSAMLAAAQGLSSIDAYRRIGDLVQKSTGGLVAGLSLQRAERLRVDVVSPLGAVPLPRVAGSPVTLESAPGPLEVVVRVASSNGVKSVRVNGQPQATDAQGLLSIPLVVGDTPSTVLVQAEDEVGAQAQTELRLVQRSAPLASAAAAPSAVAAASAVLAAAPATLPDAQALAALQGGKRHALVIANQAYKRWTPLDTPRADAQAVATVLKQRFGFEVTLLQDATRQQLLSALGKLRQQVGPQDQVVVYYAGHGQMDTVTARGYWIPVDGDQKDIAQWVSVIDVTDQLSAMSARHVLVIADSCYSGTLTRSLVPTVDQALTVDQRQGPLRQLSQQRARVAMTSGGMEPVVDGGSINHSLFARSLLDVLGQVRSPMAAQELHGAVAARFAHLARRLKIQQQPQYAPIGFAGHEAGDFVLAPI